MLNQRKTPLIFPNERKKILTSEGKERNIVSQLRNTIKETNTHSSSKAREDWI